MIDIPIFCRIFGKKRELLPRMPEDPTKDQEIVMTVHFHHGSQHA